MVACMGTYRREGLFHCKIVPLRYCPFGLLDYDATGEGVTDLFCEDLSFVGGLVLQKCIC